MKQFFRKNIHILIFFLISFGSAIFFYSRSQIPTEVQTGVQASERGIEIPKEIPSSNDNRLTPVTPPEKNTSVVTNGMTSVSSSEPSVENSTTSSFDSPQRAEDNSEKETISVTLSIPKTGYEKKIELTPGSSAYDMMKALQKQGLNFVADEHGSLGAFINTIGGIENDYKKHMFWIYYINGQKAHIGISNYILNHDDIITWQYEAEDI